MNRLVLSAALVLAVACGGGRSVSAGGDVGPPVFSPNDVVSQFMQAVADSNLTRMGQLWGTARGSAAVVGEPVRWREQVAVMQLYLRGGSSRVVSNMPGTGPGERRQLTLELERGGCVKQVPFTVLRLQNSSWLVVNVDINQAGNPARPCGVT